MSKQQTEPKVISQMRNIVAHHQHAKVGGKGGVRIDVQTANVVVQVYDALNDTNKTKFAQLGVRRMVDVAWKLVG